MRRWRPRDAPDRSRSPSRHGWSRRQRDRLFSETVLVGFKAGLALYLASTQLPKLFGFKGTHGDFWERAAYFVGHLGDTHGSSLLVGLAALTMLIAGKLWLKNRPVAFLVVVAGMLAARS